MTDVDAVLVDKFRLFPVTVAVESAPLMLHERVDDAPIVIVDGENANEVIDGSAVLCVVALALDDVAEKSPRLSKAETA